MFILLPILSLVLLPVRLTRKLLRFLSPIRRLRRLIARLRGLTPRDLWVRALRSGRYKQAKGYLCNDQGHCCLGVAAEVYQRYFGDLVIEVQPVNTNCCCPDEDRIYPAWNKVYDESTGALPDKVAKWLDINEEGYFKDGKHSLVMLNDTNDYTFSEIAEAIESDGEEFGGLCPYDGEDD